MGSPTGINLKVCSEHQMHLATTGLDWSIWLSNPEITSEESFKTRNTAKQLSLLTAASGHGLSECMRCPMQPDPVQSPKSWPKACSLSRQFFRSEPHEWGILYPTRPTMVAVAQQLTVREPNLCSISATDFKLKSSSGGEVADTIATF